MKKIFLFFSLAVVLFICSLSYASGTSPKESPNSVKKVEAEVKTQENGVTVEQENIIKRLQNDNKVGEIKHLYVISPYSGQVLIYSTVKGKVTSSGKRLNPSTVVESQHWNGWRVEVRGTTKVTSETLGDDGTYGSSDPYIYWWDVNNNFHQHMITGGQIIHISDKPIQVKSVIINVDMVN